MNIITIRGISLYYIISWFFIYSFLGWVWESSYVSVKMRKPVNRGFIYGPLCTIYGMGAVCVYLILKPFDENLLILYIGGVLVATLLEYITGWLMEKIFHTRWWDYSRNKFNVQGYICLGSSAAWGFFTLLLFKVLHPFVSWITGLYPEYIGKIILTVVSVMYGIDFGVSAFAAFDLSKTFAKVEDMLEELTGYLQNSKLYETGTEIREKLDNVRVHLKHQEIGNRLSERKQEIMAQFESVLTEKYLQDAEAYQEKKAELEQRLDEFNRKYLEIRKKQNIIKKRMFSAYPELKNEFKRYQEKHQDKKNR